MLLFKSKKEDNKLVPSDAEIVNFKDTQRRIVVYLDAVFASPQISQQFCVHQLKNSVLIVSQQMQLMHLQVYLLYFMTIF